MLQQQSQFQISNRVQNFIFSREPECRIRCTTAAATSGMGATFLFAAVICAAVCMLAPGAAGYPAEARLYASNTWLQPGFHMTLVNGAGQGGDWFLVQFQSDCNLVLNHEGHVYWGAGSNNAGQHLCYLAMQRDGNLVIYGDHDNPIWASNSAQSTLGDYYVQIQLDGNLVIYNDADRAIWASQTNWY